MDNNTGMIGDANPEVEQAPGDEDRFLISNLYLKPDPSDPDACDEDLGTTYTAFLYVPTEDMENGPFTEPEEVVSGPFGAVPFEMTRRQAVQLRDRIDSLLK